MINGTTMSRDATLGCERDLDARRDDPVEQFTGPGPLPTGDERQLTQRGERQRPGGQPGSGRRGHDELHGNDQIARGVLAAAQRRGRDVPGSLAIIGFDNWTEFVIGARPALSSIDMNLETLGSTAAHRLVSALDGEPSRGIEKLPCSVVARESSGWRE